jgi:integrase
MPLCGSSSPQPLLIDARSTQYEVLRTQYEVALLFAFDVGRQRVVQSTQHSALAARGWQRWCSSIGLNPAAYGTHSMRRTKPTLIYRRTRNLRAVQLLLGHSKLESTVRYLGIEVDDALEIAEQTEV